MGVWRQKAWTNFDETFCTQQQIWNPMTVTWQNTIIFLNSRWLLGAWIKTNAQYSCSEIWVVKWHRKRQHGYRKTVAVACYTCTILTKLEWVHATWYKKTNKSGRKTAYINTNKCVSKTDTNPPFAFQIAFPRGTDFTGFLQGGSKIRDLQG